MGTPSVTVYLDYKGTMHTFIKLDDGNGTVNQANGSFSFVVLPQDTAGTDDQDDQDDQDDLGGGSEVIRTMNLLVSSLQQQAQSLTTALN